MVQQKTQGWGRGVGFLKAKCESSSHGGKFLPLSISGRRVGICLWLWDHGCAARGCPWDGRHAQELRLHQVPFVLLTLWQLPSC